MHSTTFFRLSREIPAGTMMSRYRPPAPKKSPYITRAGYLILQTEQATLWKTRREVVKHLSAAAAEGDRSENAEYIYRKKQLRELDRRIRYLEVRMPVLKIVDSVPDDPEKIFFGATVTLERSDGEAFCYRIVGADEFDPTKNWISVDSPMAKALIKKRIDDEFTVQLPGGLEAFIVLDVNY